MRKLICLCLAFFCVQTGFAQRFISHTKILDDNYNFWFYSPCDTIGSARDSLPVILFLHGRSLCGSNLSSVFKYGTLDALNKGLKLNANVIAPQNPGGSWKPDKLIRLVDWCLKEYGGDRNRVYVIGMSLGGYGTMDLCGTYPDRIAAGIAFCGGTTLKDYTGLSKLPFWIIHGTADKAVPLSASKKVVDYLLVNHLDERLLYDWLSGFSHGILARAFYMPKFYDWLFSHNLTEEGRPAFTEIDIDNSDFDNVYSKLKADQPIPRVSYKKH